jgi:hypothetical protein
VLPSVASKIRADQREDLTVHPAKTGTQVTK